MFKSKCLCAALLAACALPTAGRCQSLPLGPEFQVSIYTGNQPYGPAIVADPNGNFVVVWSSYGQDGSGDGVFGRLFDSSGTPASAEFQVNSYTPGRQYRPALAGAGDGSFTVVWQGDYGILGRHFDSVGGPTADEFWVSTFTAASVSRPAISAGSSAALVVWERNDGGPTSVSGRVLDTSGTALGTEFTLASTGLVGLAYPDVAVTAVDEFIVVWTTVEEFGTPDFKSEIDGRRLASDGSPIGSEFQANSNPNGYQFDPAVAVDAAGGFVVAWGNYLGTYNYRLEGRRFASSGAPLGTDFTVTSRGDYLLHPDAVAAPDGGFVIAWTGECGEYCYDDPFARRYAADGSPLGDPFALNSMEEFKQEFPSIAVNADGLLMGVWVDQQEGVIEGRVFATAVSSPICSAGAIASSFKLKLGKLAAPVGDEKMIFKGKLPFSPSQPAVFDPATQGAQVLIEDTGAANAVVFELSHRTIAIPPGPGCGPDDGWTVNGTGTTHKYKNKSGALPPGCTPGSANGLTAVKFKDKRAKAGFIGFTVKVKQATMPGSITGPLRATLVTAASAAAGTAGECGGIAATSCTVEPGKISCP